MYLLKVLMLLKLFPMEEQQVGVLLQDLVVEEMKDHLKASIALHEAWRDDRYAYRHWVPQFTLYAAHLASEDSEHRSQRPCP
mgnify:CR=1 FL=1